MSALQPTAPVELYRDEALYQREREKIFARSWQFLGLEADVSRRGDYIADTLAGYPVFVVRDDQGGLRGYHNLCRHRAGPLVGDAHGRCDRELVCQFHEWRYRFDGTLIDAKGFADDEITDRDSFKLLPITVETWRGLVFVDLSGECEPLKDHLAPLEARLGGQPHRSARMNDRHEIACNWKVYVETNLDGYHLDRVLPLAPKQREVRVEGSVALIGLADDGVSTESLWAWAWPNFNLTVYRGVLMLEYMRPAGPDRTLVEHIFMHEPEDPRGDAAIVAFEDITEEDAWICERVQRNLDAGVYHLGVLSPTHDAAVTWFQARVKAALSI